MPLSPAADRPHPVLPSVRIAARGAASAALCLGLWLLSGAAMAQVTPGPGAAYQPMSQENLQQAMAQANNPQNMPSSFDPQRPGAPATPYGGINAQQAPAQPPAPQLTQSELSSALQNPDSPQYKAHRLADRAKAGISFFGTAKKEEARDGITGRPMPPPEMEALQEIHKTHGTDYNVSDDLINKEIALDMRRDAQREAALSYGARGGFAKRAYQVMERLNGYEGVLDGVMDFRQLLIRAPSGLLIEPPIVREALDAMVITEGGNEAAVADQVLRINRQAKIVSTARNWRQYLVMVYEAEIAPPPRVLWPKNKDEQAQWNTWVREGWRAGFQQAEDTFEASLNQMISDYNGMVRYRVLLAEGKISQPYAMHEDRGITGGQNEMRVGDRALRITGPSQFMTGADLWKPADR